MARHLLNGKAIVRVLNRTVLPIAKFLARKVGLTFVEDWNRVSEEDLRACDPNTVKNYLNHLKVYKFAAQKIVRR